MPPPAALLPAVLLIIILQTAAKPTLTITPTILTNPSEPITITWSDIPSPSPLDYLAIYSPPSSPFDLFIGYVFLSNYSQTHLSSGSGSLSFPSLPNLRSNYSFRIFRWSDSRHHDHDHNPLPAPKSSLSLASSPVEVGFAPARGPDQVHLSFTDLEDEMRVLFLAGDGEKRHVRYGLKEGELGETADANVERYEREDMCDYPANGTIGWRDPGWIHDAVMTNLKKGVRYYYQVGSDSGGWSKTYSFISRNDASGETIAFLFGDMGTSTPYRTYYRTQDESISTVKWILRDIEALGDKPAFVSHIGDISYARGFSWVWDHFFNLIEPVASQVPYHVCIGNHEYDWPAQPWKPDWAAGVYGTDGGGECGVPYSLKFHMPGNSSEPTGMRAPATRNLYYSFDAGVVHFLYISTETNFLPGSKQYDFIKNDLETVDRQKTPFVVVQGHRPMYTTSYENRDKPMREKFQGHLEPLFVKNNVTLALWGHVHRYERFCPINNFTCGSTDSNCETWEPLPIHVVIGMGGQDWQPIWQPRENHLTDPIFPQPERSLYRGGEFGYTRLLATREKLTLTYVGNHDGKEHDMVEVLASGRVVIKSEISVAEPVPKLKLVNESQFTTFVKVASIVVFGAFVGYVLGYVSRARRESSGKNWTPVKSEEI
ncbi:hypothetical protein MLD38_011910 [Melastoma candidum]|uniref:Uncharacterized protein n=1 Tax=Melastoma candidum TaxID=119954 RepID=A0ACB9R5N9_9MYRT|nr:hypothetical protein MLD38_011910 [Melastoma candidum]